MSKTIYVYVLNGYTQTRSDCAVVSEKPPRDGSKPDAILDSGDGLTIYGYNCEPDTDCMPIEEFLALTGFHASGYASKHGFSTNFTVTKPRTYSDFNWKYYPGRGNGVKA